MIMVHNEGDVEEKTLEGFIFLSMEEHGNLFVHTSSDSLEAYHP